MNYLGFFLKKYMLAITKIITKIKFIKIDSIIILCKSNIVTDDLVFWLTATQLITIEAIFIKKAEYIVINLNFFWVIFTLKKRYGNETHIGTKM